MVKTLINKTISSTVDPQNHGFQGSKNNGHKIPTLVFIPVVYVENQFIRELTKILKMKGARLSIEENFFILNNDENTRKFPRISKIKNKNCHEISNSFLFHEIPRLIEINQR